MKKRNLSMFLCLLICAAAFVMVGGSVSAATPFHDGWDIPGDLAGWGTNTEWTYVEVVDTGGNPGGYLYTRSEGSPGANIYYAGTATRKAEFSGNYGFAPLIKVSVDIKVLSTTSNLDRVDLRFRYHSAEYNGWRYLFSDDPILDEWCTYSVTFDPTWTDEEARSAGWVTDHDVNPSATPSLPFEVTMADVWSTEVRFEAYGAVYACIDNIRTEEGESIDLIIEEVEEMDLPQGVEDSLLSVLEAALHSIDTGNERAALQQLQAFIRMVEGMRGIKLTDVEADALIAAAQEIIDSLS
jgi:hypothetical protein